MHLLIIVFLKSLTFQTEEEAANVPHCWFCCICPSFIRFNNGLYTQDDHAARPEKAETAEEAHRETFDLEQGHLIDQFDNEGNNNNEEKEDANSNVNVCEGSLISLNALIL